MDALDTAQIRNRVEDYKRRFAGADDRERARCLDRLVAKLQPVERQGSADQYLEAMGIPYALRQMLRRR